MRRVALVGIAWLCAASAAGAAQLEGDSLRICEQTEQASAALRPSALKEATAAKIQAQGFARVYETLAQRFLATLSDSERAEAKVQTFVATIGRAGTLAPNELDVARGSRPGIEVMFGTGPSRIELNCDALRRPLDVDMATVALFARWVRSQELLPAIAQRANFIVEQSRAHEALLANGLPMWPWELWLNGKRLGASDWEPLFRTQWVLLRPGAGIEINTRSRPEGNLEASVAIEPVGFVRYLGNNYSEWWGASLLATSSTRAGIGLGALVRWNRYVLGVTRHESSVPDESGSYFVFFGFELYDLVNQKRGELDAWKDLQERRLQDLRASVLGGPIR